MIEDCSRLRIERPDPRATESRFLDRHPRTLLGAQYSLPFTTAVALVRDLSNPYAFDTSVLTDPLIGELAGRVEVEAAESDRELAIDLGDKLLRMSAIEFPGSYSQPLDYSAAADKLRRYASPLIGDARAARIAKLVNHLNQLDDVRQLAELIVT